MRAFSPYLRWFVFLALAGSQAFLPAATHASGAIRYVVPGGLWTGSCKSWASACELQQAISVAVSGDTVWVKEGTYIPGADRYDSFTLKNGVRIYGGFAGSETAIKQRNPAAHETILSGNIGSASDSSDNSYHVVLGSGTGHSAGLDGFTIMQGNANGSYTDGSYRGGGMYIDTGSPTLSNLVLSFNSADNGGGGMFSVWGSPILNNVIFVFNSAGWAGGGMYSQHGTSHLTNVTFAVNSASVGGGMLDEGGSNSILTRVTFAGNLASDSGGGMYDNQSSPTLKNVTFAGNSATNGGGGMTNGPWSDPKLTNATFSGNSAGVDDGGAMLNTWDSSPVIRNSIFWADSAPEILNDSATATVVDSLVEGGCSTGSTCTGALITSDPLLGTLTGNGGPTQTMALGVGSPAIDSGGQNSTCAKTDQRGVKRPQGPACDMGAYEAPVTRTYRSTGSLDGWVLESGENSNVGGTLNKTAGTIRLGDDASRKQYRSILSFGTASLPDHASIVSAQLVFKYSDVTPPASDPMLALGGLKLDMRKGFFGTSTGLEAADWQAAANKTIGPFSPVPDAEYYTVDLSSSTFATINRLATNGGVTQIRLRFSVDDNNDGVANMLSLISGNDATAANRPTLIIVYTTP